MVTNEYKSNTNQPDIIICHIKGRRIKGNWSFWFNKEDEKIIRKHRWNMTPMRYVKCTCHDYLLHRLIMDVPSDRVVDHISHQPENNLRNNLRIVTHAENMRNRGANKDSDLPIKGIHWNGHSWGTEITKNGQVFSKAGFDTLPEAICWKIRREYELYGDKSPNYRPILKHMPRSLLKIYLPEIYGKDNDSFIGSPIFNAHYKNSHHKNWKRHTAAVRKYVGAPM